MMKNGTNPDNSEESSAVATNQGSGHTPGIMGANEKAGGSGWELEGVLGLWWPGALCVRFGRRRRMFSVGATVDKEGVPVRPEGEETIG